MKKKVFFKWLLATILLQVPILNVSAYDFISNGVFYLITSSSEKTVSVTYGPSSNGTYSGSLNIPSSVTNGGVTYSVTGITASACYNCTELTSVNIPITLTSIGTNAFYNCTGLNGVYINDISSWCRISGLGTESSNPLYYAKNLYLNNELVTSITIPSMYTIPVGAFQYCNSIKEVVISYGPTTIGENVFNNCQSLSSITIPASVTRIEGGAFKGCNSLRKVIFKDGTTALTLGKYSYSTGRYGYTYTYGIFGELNLSYLYIGRPISSEEHPFYSSERDNEYPHETETKIYVDVTKLEFGKSVSSLPFDLNGSEELECVILPSSFSSIPDNAFCGCNNLDEITLPESLTRIGNKAFYGCSCLNTISIPQNVTSIGANAFDGCNLSTLTIPSRVTTIGNNAFSNNKALNDVSFYATNCSSSGTSSYPVFSGSPIGNVIIGSEVKTIPSYLFYGCDKLASVVIPNSVQSIGRKAFFKCTRLASVSLPNSVTSISPYAFSSTALQIPLFNSSCFVYLPTQYSGNYAVLDGISTICGGAFAGSSELTRIILPASVRTISDEAFKGCYKLTECKIPENVTQIGNYAFSGCKGLTELIIPDAVTNLGNNVCLECVGLTKVTLPKGLQTIPTSMFSNCKALETAEIPEMAKSIGASAFATCSSLKHIRIPEAVTSISTNSFTGCNSVESLEFYPKSGTLLNAMSAIKSPNLKNVKLGNALDVIPTSIFSGCTGLTSVEIGESVSIIQSKAFEGCTALTDITLDCEPPSCGTDVFPSEIYNSCTLNVPQKLNSLYYNTDPWWNFKSIQIIPNTDIEYSLLLNKSNLILKKGGNYQLTVEVYPENEATPTVTWSSSDTSVASVDENGLVIAQNAGSANILAEASSGISATCKITVAKLQINKSELTLNSGESYCLVASFNPLTDSDPQITWTSSDSHIATVDDKGNVIAKGTGLAIIKAKDASGDEVSCHVTVKEASGSSFVIENQEIRKGRVTSIPVLMNNDISVVSFNCDITLPEGLTLAKDQYSDYEITLSERCDNTHSISASDLNGKIRVVEYSSKNHAITGNEGTLFYLPVEIADDVEPGTELSIGISDIYLTEQESFKEVSCQDITASLTVLPAYTSGDINNDGKYSAADVSLAVEYALGRTPANGVAEAADVNNDGKVSAADISIIVSYVLSGKVANSQNAPARRMLAAASVAKCAFTAEDITGEKGATVELPVSLDFGDLEAVSFQCDIYLPEGVSVATDAYGEPYAELLSDRIVDHTINVAKQADGAYRFLSFSNKNRTYLGKDGVMFKVPLVLDAEAGNYSIGIKAATVTESETFTEFESAESSVELSITEAESVVEPEDFQFYTNKLVIAEGETEATLEFSFKNSEEVSGFAFDVVLPEGMTPVLDSEGYAEIEYGDRIPSRFDVDGEEIDGVFHIEGATTRNTSVESGDDVLFTLKLSVSAAPRFYGLNITNQTATLADGTETSVGDYTSIIKIQGTENVNLYIPNGGWATLCLLFAAEVPAGMKVYKAVGIENSAVVLEEQGKITANTPVIVSGAEGNYSFAENNKAANRINYKDGLLTSTLLDIKFSEGYVLQQQSNGFGFYRLTSAKTLPSYRCVLNNTQAVGAPTYMPIKFEDATRVDGLFKGEVDNVIYTLDGKKVDSMLKNNVYIINGNKVLIK